MRRHILKIGCYMLLIIIFGCGQFGSDSHDKLSNEYQQPGQQGEINIIQKVLARSSVIISISTESNGGQGRLSTKDLLSSQSVTIQTDVSAFMDYNVSSDISFHVEALEVVEAEGGIYIDFLYNDLIDPALERIFVRAYIEDANGLVGVQMPENIIPLEIMGMDIASFTALDADDLILKEWLPPYNAAINDSFTLQLRVDFTQALAQQFTGTIIMEFVADLDYQLVFWNRLGSDEEVLTSEVGPGLTFSTDVNRTYVPGQFGNAIMPTSKNIGGTIIHNLILDNIDQCLNPENGTIEFWYKQSEDPVPFQYGVYRIFDGPWGFSSGVDIYAYKNPEDPNDYGLYFSATFGMPAVYTYTLANPARKGLDISAYNGIWIHVAAVWDRGGINGTNEYMRLYIDGQKMAVSYNNNWGTDTGTQADIAGGQDSIDSKFCIDNLKIYEGAKTDFSDRFYE